MKITFTKMQACGNDYIFINCITDNFDINVLDDVASLCRNLSNRHFGVGGDGVVLIKKSTIANAKMVMYNQDGSMGSMCGNAIRCVAKYLYENNIVPKIKMNIETSSGIKNIELFVEKNIVTSVSVNMGLALLDSMEIGIDSNISGDLNRIVNEQINMFGRCYSITCVSIGNPHAVIFCDNVNEIDLEKVASVFKKSNIFLKGINIELLDIVNKKYLKARVFKSGIGETLSCGTGCCAAVVAACLNGYCDKCENINVEMNGGVLFANYSDESVILTGECKKVFDGIIYF